MRVLLTGASGFIGSHLAAALLARGHEVIAAGRHPGRDARMGFIPADFAQDTEKAVWLARLRNVDAVVNAAGIFRPSAGGQSFAALHDAGPRALFAACAEAGVAYVVQVSALGADAGAASAFHASKKAADDALARLPLRGCIVLPSLVYGADGASARLFRMLATLPLAVRLGRSPQLVQPVHIDDVSSAVRTLLEQGVAAPAAAGGAAQIQRLALAGPAPMGLVEYLATLRAGMGLRPWRLPVLRLPGWLARTAAALAGLLPGSPLDRDALRMLERGNTADAGPLQALLGRPPRAPRDFIAQPAAERTQAQLAWLLPLLRASLAAVWIWTAIVSAFFYPVAESYALLARTGVPAMLAPLMLYGASALDLLLGIATLAWPRRSRRYVWLAQIALIAVYSIAIALRLPEFLLHPYGPLSKNLPMLAALWMLYELEKPQWNT